MLRGVRFMFLYWPAVGASVVSLQTAPTGTRKPHGHGRLNHVAPSPPGGEARHLERVVHGVLPGEGQICVRWGQRRRVQPGRGATRCVSCFATHRVSRCSCEIAGNVTSQGPARTCAPGGHQGGVSAGWPCGVARARRAPAAARVRWPCRRRPRLRRDGPSGGANQRRSRATNGKQ